jgi:hypothetical protein
MGCISKGIAHCGKRQFQDAMKAFDLAFMYVDVDLNKTRLLLLIKVRQPSIVSHVLTTDSTAVRPSPFSMQINKMKQFCASKSYLSLVLI